MTVALLVALVGGAAFAAMAAARRTDRAFPEFVQRYGFDAVGYADFTVPQVARLPEVRSAVPLLSPIAAQPRCACSSPIDASDFGISVERGQSQDYVKLLTGHYPSSSDPRQALVSFTMAQTYGLHIGSRITVPFYAPSQEQAYFSATGTYPKPTGPTVTFDVVGTEASEGDFPDGQTPSYDMVVGPGFGPAFSGQVADSIAYLVRLRAGPGGLAKFSNDVTALNRAGMLGYESVDSANSAVQGSIAPQATGWWVLAALAGLVGIIVLAQALSRQSRAEAEGYGILMTLGMSRDELIALAMLRTLAVGLLGALGAVLFAFALSPLTPLGEARIALPSAGFSFDSAVLLLGAGGLVVAVLLLGVWPAIRSARVLRAHDAGFAITRPSSVATQLANGGAPPSVVIGVRHAVERGRGRSGIPARAALLGTVLGVTALCGTAVFGASLTNLVTHPSLYGVLYQLNFNDGAVGSPLEKQLQHDPSVQSISQGFGSELSVERVAFGVLALTPLKGPLLVTTLHGHAPDGPRQIALGANTMRRVGARVGSTIPVSLVTPKGAPRTVPFKVVAEAAIPLVAGNTSIGNGAVVTQSGYLAAVCPQGPQQDACRAGVLASTTQGMIAATVPTQAGTRTVARYLREDPSVVSAPTTPTSLVNFGQAVNFPLLFALLLMVFAIATLVHVLALTVARRGREFAVLRVLGFLRQQVAFTVTWQATTSAVVGALIGVPAGIALGRAVWLAFAKNLGVVPATVIPTVILAVLVAAVLVVANAIAVVPAYLSTRPRPYEALRTIDIAD